MRIPAVLGELFGALIIGIVQLFILTPLKHIGNPQALQINHSCIITIERFLKHATATPAAPRCLARQPRSPRAADHDFAAGGRAKGLLG